MSKTVVDNVQDFKTRSLPVKAIQFTGTNSKEVAAFLNESGYKARAGGKYVKIIADNGDSKLLKGNIVVRVQNDDHVTHVEIYFTAEEFKKKFIVSKTNELI